MNIKQNFGSLKGLWGQVSGCFHIRSLSLLKQPQIDDSAFFIYLWPLDDNSHPSANSLSRDLHFDAFINSNNTLQSSEMHIQRSTFIILS